MTIRFLADEDLNRDIVDGLRRIEPALDFETATQAGLLGMPDPEVLALAAAADRVLVSHDFHTMPWHFADFIAEHESAGVILISQKMDLRDAIEGLLSQWAESNTEEWRNRIFILKVSR
jgi:predicted nuclease of predicted toxin-antitoxin system